MTIESYRSDYQALSNDVGAVHLQDHIVIAIHGEDRLQLLHSFCTADIKALDPGQCCEAFILNDKGKVLAFVHVLARVESLLIIAHGDCADKIIQHLDKYVIREDVTFENLTESRQLWFVVGPNAAEKLNGLAPLPGENKLKLGETVYDTVAQLEVAGNGFLFVVPGNANEFKAALDAAAIVVCDNQALNSIRVESGTPWNAVDVDDSNLPQELCRDEKSISFEKGCYLGQETVARLDALGRVNWLWRVLEMTGETVPSAGEELVANGKRVARLKSVGYSFAAETWLAVGYVRRGNEKAGTELEDARVR